MGKAIITALLVVPALFVASLVGPGRAEAGTLHVGPGEPHTTIQSAIDAASDGDMIIVRDGTYTGSGNRDIDFGGKAIHLMSENGPENCIIDCQGSEAEPHRGFYFHSGEDESTVVDGFTIKNGYADGSREERDGGGINCYENSSPTITNNTITGNTADRHGGGISCRENSSPTITNNTITGNTASSAGAIDCDDSSPTIANNTITGNTANSGGGGIYCSHSSPTITNNTITGNTTYQGGGIRCYLSSPTITNNTITGNTANYGGGMYCYYSSPTITNNTITGNVAERGGGVYSWRHSLPTVTNTIVWGNDAMIGAQIWVRYTSTLTISYSDVEGGEAGIPVEEGGMLVWGEGNIDADPLFADPDNGDYHLKSKYGRWDPHANGGAGGWVNDDVNSPCIDMGDPASDPSLEPLPNSGRINMGAYGNTAQASKSPPHWLTVRSVPVTGISISADKPGVTDYRAPCDDGEVVDLTAPAIATSTEGVDRTFVRWDGYPDGVATIALTMDSDKTAVAVYEGAAHILAVGSTPITGVAITGDRPGTTNYTAVCFDEDVVTLTAPSALIVANMSSEFVRWVVDGSDSPDGQNTVEITIGADHRAVAVYQQLGAGTVFLVGPMDRGEGALPPVAGDPTDPGTFGEFTVDIYAENMPGFAGFQLQSAFLDHLLQDRPGFWVSYSTPNPLFAGRAIVHNTLFLPEIDHACLDQTVGLMSMETGFIPPFGWGDYVDKSIPPEEDLAAVNPSEMVLSGHEGLTWLMSVNYWYTSDVPEGTYTISVDGDLTAFGNSTDPPSGIPYALVPGSLTIGWPGEPSRCDRRPQSFE